MSLLEKRVQNRVGQGENLCHLLTLFMFTVGQNNCSNSYSIQEPGGSSGLYLKEGGVILQGSSAGRGEPKEHALCGLRRDAARGRRPDRLRRSPHPALPLSAR